MKISHLFPQALYNFPVSIIAIAKESSEGMLEKTSVAIQQILRYTYGLCIYVGKLVPVYDNPEAKLSTYYILQCVNAVINHCAL
jgi:hypothetical protein